MSNNLPSWWAVAEQNAHLAGVDVGVLRQLTGVESGFRNVANQSGPGGRPTSSAFGPGQIIERTWNGFLRNNPQFQDTPDRRNPYHQARIMPHLLASKVNFVKRRVGRDLSPGEQYLSWFAGEGDAARVLLADPSSPVAAVVSSASIRANPSVFRNIKTTGDLIAWADRKMGGTSARDGTQRRSPNPQFTEGQTVSPAMANPRDPITRAQERAVARMTEEDAYSQLEGAGRAIWQENGLNWLSQHFGGPAGDPNWSFDPKAVPDWVPTDNLSFLGRANSEADFQARINRLEHDMEVERRLAAMGWSGVGYRFLGALLDPVGIAAGVLAAPVAGVAKVGRIGQIAIGATAGAGVNVLAEIPQAMEKPTWTPDHLMYTVGAGALLGGTMTGLLGRRGPDADQQIVQMERQAERLVEQSRMTSDVSSAGGAMATPGRVDNVRTDVADFNTRDVAEAFEGSAMSKVRFDTTNFLKSSPIPMVRMLGHALAVDGVGRADPTQAAMRAVTVEQNRLFKKMDTYFMRDYTRSMDDFVERNWRDMGGRGNATEFFNTEVTRAIRNPDPMQKLDPAIAEMVSSHGKLMKIYNDLAKGDHRLVDGTTRRALPGFLDVPDNPNYILRSLHPVRVMNLEGRLGSRGLERLIAESILSANPSMNARLAFRIAKGYAQKQRNLRAGVEDSMNRSISKGDAQGIRQALEDIGIGGKDLEAALAHFTRRDRPSATPRGKHRQLLNENFETDIRLGPGRTERVRIDEMFDNDVLKLWRSYNRDLSGQIALQRLRVENPRWREGDGPEVPRYLIDGITSDGEWQKLVQQAKAAIADHNNTVPTNQRIGVDDVERALDFLWRSIRGHRLEGDVTYEQVGRILRNLNFARLMGQVAFAQIQDLTQSIAVTGWRTALSSMPGLRAFTRRAADGKLNDSDFRFLEDLGIGTDWMRSRGPAMDDMGSPVGNYRDPGLQKFLDRAEHWSHSAGRFTNLMSGMSSIMTFIHRQGAMSIMMSFAREAAGKSGINAKRLAVLGVDPQMRGRILDEIKKGWDRTGGGTGTKRGEIAARMDLDRWDPEVRNAFEYAIFEGSRRIALEGDPGMSRALLNTTTGKILTQFRTFAINSWTQNTLHNLHMKDIGTFTNIVTSSVLAGITWYGLASLRSIGMSPSQKEEYLEQNLRAEKVLLAGIGRTAFSSLMPTMVDTALQVLGQEPLFNDFRTTGQTYRLFDFNANPTVDLLNRSARLLGSVMDGEISASDFRNAMGILPLNNFLPMAWFKNAVAGELPR